MKHVLIVDDSQTVRNDIAQALQGAGFGTVEAGDGADGLERARQQRFSLIILDVNMPRMNGLEMLDNLRLDFATADVPVVVLTTEAEEVMIQRARKAGVKGWLIKPVAAAHIVSTAVAITSREKPHSVA